MNGNHLTGGTIGLLVGVVAARYGFDVSDAEAGVIGAAVASIGGVVAHVVTGPGVFPAVRRALYGPKGATK